MNLYIYNNWNIESKTQEGELKEPLVVSDYDVGEDYTKCDDLLTLKEFDYVFFGLPPIQGCCKRCFK